MCSAVPNTLWLYGPPGSSVLGISKARVLEWVAISFSRGSSWPRDPTHVSYVSCIAGKVFTHWAFGEALQESGRFIFLHGTSVLKHSPRFTDGKNTLQEGWVPRGIQFSFYCCKYLFTHLGLKIGWPLPLVQYWEHTADERENESNTTHREKRAPWSTTVEFFSCTYKQERSLGFENPLISLLSHI